MKDEPSLIPPDSMDSFWFTDSLVSVLMFCLLLSAHPGNGKSLPGESEQGQICVDSFTGNRNWMSVRAKGFGG